MAGKYAGRESWNAYLMRGLLSRLNVKKGSFTQFYTKVNPKRLN